MELNSIAFIPDGNRRYAKMIGLPLFEAYRIGTQKAWNVIDWLSKYRQVKVGTFYTLSLENIKRSAVELNVLFKIFEHELDKIRKSKVIEGQGIRLKFVGRLDLLPGKLQQKMEEAVDFTSEYDKKTINLAIGYDGQQEIVDAAKKIALEYKQGNLDLDSLNPESFHNYLYTENVNPDLIVRTSGAERLSGFLTYQSSYSELAFIDKYWPQLTELDLDDAVREYYNRKRTFGK